MPDKTSRRPLRMGVPLTVLLVLCSMSLEVQGQPAAVSDSADAEPQWVLLPSEATDAVKGRYHDRLDKALAGIALPPTVKRSAGSASGPASLDGPCALSDACLAQQANKLSAKHVVALVLDARGDDFALTTVRFVAGETPRIDRQVLDIKHHALAKAARTHLEAELKRLAVSAAVPAQAAAAAEVQKAAPPEVVVPAETAQPGQAELPGAASAPDEGQVVAQAEDEVEPQTLANPAAADKKQPTSIVISVEELAARMGAAETGDLSGGALRKPSGVDKVVVQGNREDLNAGQVEGRDSYWAHRGAAYAGEPEDTGARRERQKTILLMALAGLSSASLGFFLGYRSSLKLRRRKVSFDAKVQAKEEAMTMSVLRTCAKQLTPGVLMSAEFETSKRFCFSLVDGKQVSVDVMRLSEEERAAFRIGMQLCAQFVHKDGTAMCMMTVLRTQVISPSRLRLVMTAPERLAQVTTPKGFKIPVDARTPLLAHAMRDTDKGVDTWQGRVQVVSSASLEMRWDEDAFTMVAGERVTLKLRLDDIRAELVGLVTSRSDASVSFDLEDKHGGNPPREYQNLLRKLEGQWLSTLGAG